MNDVLPSKIDGYSRPVALIKEFNFERLSRLLSEYEAAVQKYRAVAESVVNPIGQNMGSPVRYMTRWSPDGTSSRFHNISPSEESLIDELSYLNSRLKRLIGLGSSYVERIADDELEKLELDLKLLEAEKAFNAAQKFIQSVTIKGDK